MIIISGLISVDPEDVDAFVELLSPLVEATLAEDGNRTYGFYADPLAPGAFRVYEEWDGEDPLNAHMASAHMAEFIGAMAGLRVTGTEIHRHDVSGSQRFM